MTLRDEFAKAAMQGYLAAPDLGWTFDEVAVASYKMADAMLAARGAETAEQRYERLEREHLGDPEKRTGIYAPELEGGDGPGEEDGPWAAGWEERTGQKPLPTDPDGWIVWNGGPCPVAYNALVQVEFHDGEVLTGVANTFIWVRLPNYAPIVRYRVVTGGLPS